MRNEPKATVDFETRGACNLKTHGTWRYSIHPSTEILCLVWRLPSWPTGKTAVWHPAFPSLGLPEHCDTPELAELFEWIEDGGLVEAHNIWFEYCIWSNILVERYGWPGVPLQSWRCSAAKCATHSMHRDLDKAAAALKLRQRKDLEGAKVMKKMTKPRKSRKAERVASVKSGIPLPKILYHESPEMLDRLIQYCRQDVLTEEAVSHALPDLSPQETQMFLMDLRMNATGFQLDKDAVAIAQRLIHREMVLLNQELTLLTDRKVKKATQREKMMAWLAENGLQLPDTQKATLDGLLQAEGASALTGLDPKVRRALEVMRALGRSSTAKYKAMRDWMAKDGRVRGGLLYHGASTGRWSGKGPQIQNFPKGTQKVDMDVLWRVLKTGLREDIARDYRSVMEALSNGLRGALIALKGHQLFVADYASIEARVLLWLADDEEALELFRTGADIYCVMAESIYGYPCNKKDHPDERALGKIATLALGFQMGAPKFVDSCAVAGIHIDEDFAKVVVNAYRTKNWRVKQLWEDYEYCAILAVESRKRVRCGYVTWFVEGKFLYCELPSGRRLAYPFPEVSMREMPWGGMRAQLSFMGVDSYSHKWKRQTTYGGSLAENGCQAVARDILAEAMLRLDQHSTYRLLLAVHDETICEAPIGHGSLEEYTQILEQVPEWADGCPIAAESWMGPRYHK